jgi:transcription factor WhiB
MTDLDWRRRAGCREVVPDFMFPAGTDTAGIEAARRVCWRCPVLTVCLEAALAAEKGLPKDSRFGVFGGRTGQERYNIQMSRRPSQQKARHPRAGGRKPAECGTPAAYDRHCRDGEEIDDACREAHNEKNRETKARTRAKQVGA